MSSLQIEVFTNAQFLDEGDAPVIIVSASIDPCNSSLVRLGISRDIVELRDDYRGQLSQGIQQTAEAS